MLALQLISTIVVAGIGGYLGAYFKEKGKNLATKEDVEGITRIVESVKHENAKELAELSELLKSHASMRSAAVEKRLEVHQTAYALSAGLFRYLFGDQTARREFEFSLRDFWMNNCLYLDEPARAAFDVAWTAFLRHPTLVDRRNGFQPNEVTENYAKMTNLSRAIELAAALPPINVGKKLESPDSSTENGKEPD